MSFPSEFEAAKLRSAKAALKQGHYNGLASAAGALLPDANPLGLKPETLELLKAAGETFNMTLSTQTDQLSLQAEDIVLLVRKGQSVGEDWLVFAFPILKPDDEDLLETLSYFSILSHQTVHAIDFPMIFGMNPKSREMEVLIQVHVETMSVEDLSHLLAVFMEGVRYTLQVHE